MAVLGTAVDTIVDVVTSMAPDGSQLKIAEVLNKEQPILQDIPWVQGNSVTGHTFAVRGSLPQPSWRALNEGVPLTKSTTTAATESCGMLEDFSQVDRKLAMLSGDVQTYRVQRAKPHLEGMAQTMAQTVIYGNANSNPKAFTGFAPRYNSVSSGNQRVNVIDAGGTGSNLRSIYLINWAPDKVYGIYPKGTVAGLQHEDATSGSDSSIPGAPPAMVLMDANGNQYMGYKDHWEWNCGLVVEDWRYVVRIANIDPSALTLNHSSGPWLQDLMIQALETIQDTNGNPKWYMPRSLRAWMRRQVNNDKNAFLSMEDLAGQKVMAFGEVEVKRLDALNTAEARVV